MKGERLIFIIIFVIVGLYTLSWIPWLIVHSTNDIIHDINDTGHHNVALIFGGLHDVGDELSETNRERLLAGTILLDQDKVDSIVVSNTPAAAEAMKVFLLEHGVIEEQIELDTTAVVTEDSCVTERNMHLDGRSIIFVSHGYHLPRILFACKRLGVMGIGVPAEDIAPVEREPVSAFTTARVRFQRNQREAFLTLLNILGLYGPTLK